ncbi:MAG: HIT family protein [Candidatus Thorarchaeota archaeon]
MSDPLFNYYLAVPWKADYVRSKKDPNRCILCEISQKRSSEDSWEVFRDDKVIVLLNKFPYTPGHLLIAPLEHFEEFTDLPQVLITRLTLILQRSVLLLNRTHSPMGFNVGLNLGDAAGGSIRHIHWHVVPRYRGDLNFMDILRTRTLIETLDETLAKLQKHSQLLAGSP